MDWPKAIEEARARIAPHILETPLMPCPALSERSGARVWLKLESEQHTGSFKARGALNKVMVHSAEEKARGLITASTGNHARGFARALSISGDRGTIVLPENADPAKVAALRRFDVELSFHGKGCLEAELYAKARAEESGTLWVSPYNVDDPGIALYGYDGVDGYNEVASSYVYDDYGRDSLFEFALENGHYRVTAAVGRPASSYPNDPHNLSVEGVVLVDDEPTTDAERQIVRSVEVDLIDGKLSLEVGGMSELSGNWAYTFLAYVEIEAID